MGHRESACTGEKQMKAVLFDRHGGPEVLHLAEVPDPVAEPGEPMEIHGIIYQANGTTPAPDVIRHIWRDFASRHTLYGPTAYSAFLHNGETL